MDRINFRDSIKIIIKLKNKYYGYDSYDYGINNYCCSFAYWDK